MLYRTLGTTGLKVSEIGFGCGNVGGLMVRGGFAEQLEAVRRALDLGINYFDTAAGYGDGKSEINLGRVLSELEPGIVLATKARHGPQDLGDLQKATVAHVNESLRRLGRKSVDLIQLHTRVVSRRGGGRFALLPGEVLGRGGVLEGFKELRAEGKVRFFGFSGLGDPEALEALVESGEFHSFQVYYNLLNPSAGHPVPAGFSALDYRLLIERAAKKGMGAVVIRVLAAGVLTATPQAGGGSSPEPLSPGSELEADRERARRLDFLVQGEIRSLAQAAIRFALMKPEVSTVLVGFSNVAQIEEAAACSGAGGLPESAMARLRELWRTDFGRLGGAQRGAV